MRLFSVCVLVLCTLSLSACWLSPYYREVAQGNILEENRLAKLKVGMSREDVVALLGTPVLQHPFHHDRWDYVYYRRDKVDSEPMHGVTIEFKNNRVKSIEKIGAKAE